MKNIILRLLVTCISAPLCSGAILYQSASLGITDGYLGPAAGILGFNFQSLGSRFYLPQSATITAVGGDLESVDANEISPVIASIVSLAGPNALPSGMPFDSTTLATATFSPPSVSTDVRVPLSLNLGPGWYGSIFSAPGMFSAEMPLNNTDLPGASYFIWTGVPFPPPANIPNAWLNSGPQTGERFVVEGNFAPATVPESGSAAFAGGGLLLILLRFRYPHKRRSK